MNCSQIRDQLPLLPYGDLDSDVACAVQAHLSSCPLCQREYTALGQVRRQLASVPSPQVTVDLPRLFQEAVARQVRQIRRWRRAALAVTGIAAAVVLVMVLRLEVRLDPNQLTVRWGTASAEPVLPATPAPAPEVVVRHETVPSPDLQERLHWMSDTLHALADSLDLRDARMRQSLEGRVDTLEARIELMRRQNGQRWNDTERSVAAIYKAMFVLPNKGEKQ
jgi:predicted anti-sigma-YlaC factor YlaD